MKIKAQKNGALNETDRLQIAALLVKAGYTVRLGREKESEKSTRYEYFIEAVGGIKNAEQTG